jgi:hypothetical protein
MNWTALIAAVLAILKSFVDGKAKEDGKREARAESLENQARSISKARAIERDADAKHRRGGDDAYEPDLFRD